MVIQVQLRYCVESTKYCIHTDLQLNVCYYCPHIFIGVIIT